MRKKLIFWEKEYRQRVRKTREMMEDMEMLLVMDSANMNYLTGYDAAFYAGNMALNIWI